MNQRINDDLQRLLDVLPPHIRQTLLENGNLDNLLEVVLDLGRVPTARYVAEEIELSPFEITPDDILSVIIEIGDFDADNRAGMERTLHRISAIRNRKSEVVGLTCRVGRAVYGTIEIIRELILSGESVLMLGPPGVGKTTMLREAARVLSEMKRVVIVDTSNEIGGDGDIPHPAIGKARRMQVAHPELQHEVMIEAVENHNPEAIVIDEIGRELEAQAARTIAERGVQLIGTAHGNTLQNLMLNPTLSDLVGGIEAVTLSDDEARRRGTQKTVLERRSPPTFDILIELQTRDHLVVVPDVSQAVDLILRRSAPEVELRVRDEDGEISIQRYMPDLEPRLAGNAKQRSSSGQAGDSRNHHNPPVETPRRGVSMVKAPPERQTTEVEEKLIFTAPDNMKTLHIYVYGVARNRLYQAGKRLNVPLEVVEDLEMADAVVTLKNYYRKRPRAIVIAEREGKPIFVLRSNTVSQMENFLIDLFKLEVRSESPFGEAMTEVESAIMSLRSGAYSVDLTPQSSHVRRRQHELARSANLYSESHGEEPKRFVRIYNKSA
ncbi:AAA family ATPase [Anaerolineales bacterium]